MNTSEKRKLKLLRRFKEQYIEECCNLKVGSRYKTFRGYEIVKEVDVDSNGNFLFTIYYEYGLYCGTRTEQWMVENFIKVRK